MIGRRPTLCLIPALALVLTGCDGMSAADADYVAVCTDTGTNMPTAGGYTAPPVGQKVSVGQYTTPRVSTGGKAPVVARAGAVPAGGGAVIRGGFGAGAAKSGGSGS